MVIDVDVKTAAEYVLIEAPIPAGCSYGAHNQSNSQDDVHREYFKEKVSIFAENMTPGHHIYRIELEPRFSGSYTLNPAKAELMYFPVISDHNATGQLQINDGR
jgi:hypothetical protein